MSARLLAVPDVQDVEAFRDLSSRIAFHFSFVELETLVVPVADSHVDEVLASLEAHAVPPGFDQSIAAMVGEISDRIEVVPSSRVHPSDLVATADAILVWDSLRYEGSVWEAATRSISTRRIARVDPNVDPLEGSRYVEVAAAVHGRHDRHVLDSRRRFHEIVAESGRADVAYLLGTGPSIERYQEFDFSDGIVIACNTVVQYRDLLDQVDVRFLAIADPVFHFGVSEYAATFRSVLAEAIAERQMTAVVPSKYLPLLASLLPDVADRIVGIPMVHAMARNLDLRARFAVAGTENVLTALMYPLGATIGRELRLIGFDGRDPDADEGTFWRHAPDAQLPELIDGVRGAHPAFFNRSYADYYLEHVGNVERYSVDCERLGIRVVSLAESRVPALMRRRDEATGWEVPEIRGSSYAVVSINPDWIDEFGHHAAYDRLLRATLAERRTEMISLTSRGLVSSDPRELPTFTHPSWAMGKGSPQVFYERFHRELRGAIDRIRDAYPGLSLRLIMYTASIGHALAALEIAVEVPQTTFLLNLMRDHEDVLPAAPDGRPTHPMSILLGIAECARGMGVHLAADSEELRAILARAVGVELPVWPMFGVTDLTEVETAVEKRHVRSRVRVYCPGTMQYAKGYDIFAQAAQRILGSDDSVEFSMRRVIDPSGSHPRLIAVAQRAAERGVRMVEGTLSAREYAAELARCDVVAIPYRDRPFRTRTSGVLADAIRLGKPIVATESTWAGRVVSDLGIGATARDGDVDDLIRAIDDVVGDLDRYQGAVAAAGPSWVRQHGPGALVDMIESLPAPTDHLTSRERSLLTALSGVVRGGNEALAAGSLTRSRRLAADQDAAVLAGKAGIESRNERIHELDRAIRQRDERIDSLQAAVARRDESIQSHRLRVTDLDQANKSQAKHIADLRDSLSASEAENERLQQLVSLRDAEIASLRRTLRNRVWLGLKRALRR